MQRCNVGTLKKRSFYKMILITTLKQSKVNKISSKKIEKKKSSLQMSKVYEDVNLVALDFNVLNKYVIAVMEILFSNDELNFGLLRYQIQKCRLLQNLILDRMAEFIENTFRILKGKTSLKQELKLIDDKEAKKIILKAIGSAKTILVTSTIGMSARQFSIKFHLNSFD